MDHHVGLVMNRMAASPSNSACTEANIRDHEATLEKMRPCYEGLNGLCQEHIVKGSTNLINEATYGEVSIKMNTNDGT